MTNRANAIGSTLTTLTSTVNELQAQQTALAASNAEATSNTIIRNQLGEERQSMHNRMNSMEGVLEAHNTDFKEAQQNWRTMTNNQATEYSKFYRHAQQLHGFLNGQNLTAKTLQDSFAAFYAQNHPDILDRLVALESKMDQIINAQADAHQLEEAIAVSLTPQASTRLDSSSTGTPAINVESTHEGQEDIIAIIRRFDVKHNNLANILRRILTSTNLTVSNLQLFTKKSISEVQTASLGLARRVKGTLNAAPSSLAAQPAIPLTIMRTSQVPQDTTIPPQSTPERKELSAQPEGSSPDPLDTQQENTVLFPCRAHRQIANEFKGLAPSAPQGSTCRQIWRVIFST